MCAHVQGVPEGEVRVTCTACAGTLLLELGLLSRLTGNPVYERSALHAAKQVFGAFFFPSTHRCTLWMHDRPSSRPSSKSKIQSLGAAVR